MSDEKPKLHVLAPPPRQLDAALEPNPGVIAMLEDLLARARTGEIRAAVTITKISDTYGHDFAGIESISSLLGFNTMCDIVKNHLLEIIATNSER